MYAERLIQNQERRRESTDGGQAVGQSTFSGDNAQLIGRLQQGTKTLSGDRFGVTDHDSIHEFELDSMVGLVPPISLSAYELNTLVVETKIESQDFRRFSHPEAIQWNRRNAHRGRSREF